MESVNINSRAVLGLGAAGVAAQAQEQAPTPLRLRKLDVPTEKSALEMDYMAECVRKNRQLHALDEEGLQNHRLMEAIYRAAREGRTVNLAPVSGKDVFRGPLPSS